MSEGKKNIIGMLLEEYDIKSAKDIEDQQLQRRWSPTCGTKNFNKAGSSRRLTSAHPRFWVFSDCTFLDNSRYSMVEKLFSDILIFISKIKNIVVVSDMLLKIKNGV